MPYDTNLETSTASPLARLRAVHQYAVRVFEDESVAATWLSRAHVAINRGLCAVGAACQDVEGYREAIAELGRIERQGVNAPPRIRKPSPVWPATV